MKEQSAPGPRGLTRRQLIERGGVVAAALATPGLLAACAPGQGVAPAQPTEAATSAPTASAAAAPKTGGRLRIAHQGGGTIETLDPHKSRRLIDEARDRQLYDTLTFFNPDFSVENNLAESITPNADATQWQIKLRSGVTFHNGKTLTADDVLYTWKRILDKATASGGAGAIANLDMTQTKKVSDSEVLAVLKTPQVTFPILLTGREQSIVPDGWTDFTKPVGTGPFMFVSFTVGERSLFKRNPNYWRRGQPYADELEQISIPDVNGRLNALLGGQVDAVEAVPYADARSRANDPSIKVVRSKSLGCRPWVFQMDQKPFDDARVRQALAFAVDRQKAIDVAMFGFGTVGNDLFGKGTPMYDTSIPQRAYDPEKAKSLLKQAGQENLKVVLHTTAAGPAQVESSSAFKQHAIAAGIDIEVRVQDSVQYYNKVPFFQTHWNFGPELMFPFAFQPDAPYNESHFKDANFAKLYLQAEATPDVTKRKSLYSDLQKILFDQVPYIIWSFYEFTDAVAPKVNGVVPHQYFNLGAFQFRTWWLS